MTSGHDTEAADRVAIHELLVAYGTTLDTRDFDGFAALFGTDGLYETALDTATRGPDIAAMMRHVFATGPNATREPNFHLFFNEVVSFEGPDQARAHSMSMFMIPNENKRPMVAMAARYEDELVRKDGRWLFARRRVKSIQNGPWASD